MPDKKPTVKKLTMESPLWRDIKSFYFDKKQKLMALAKDWEKFRDIIKNNYELGRYHLARGNVQDAILRFKFVTWLEPLHGDAWYYLGCSYLADGKKKQAIEALRKALKIKPDNDQAVYMLAIAGDKTKNAITSIPLPLLVEHFDVLAPVFTGEQLQKYRYEGHIFLGNAVRPLLVPGRKDYVIVDLGVGSGLCGALLRDAAKHLSGVDISQAMLAEAAKLQDAGGLKLYDALIRQDAQAFFNDSPAQGYDVIIAAGLVSYIGDLQPFFQQISRVLKAGGIFAFTADQMEGDGLQFDTELARFRFSKKYLMDVAKANRLKEMKFETVAAYPDNNAWLCVYTT